MIKINERISLPESEIDVSAVRSQGAGGQNVNKVATAIQLRFDIPHSSLPQAVKDRLVRLNDQRVNKDGVLVIKSQEYRSQERNHRAAILSPALPPGARGGRRNAGAGRLRRAEGLLKIFSSSRNVCSLCNGIHVWAINKVRSFSFISKESNQ